MYIYIYREREKNSLILDFRTAAPTCWIFPLIRRRLHPPPSPDGHILMGKINPVLSINNPQETCFRQEFPVFGGGWDFWPNPRCSSFSRIAQAPKCRKSHGTRWVT